MHIKHSHVSNLSIGVALGLLATACQLGEEHDEAPVGETVSVEQTPDPELEPEPAPDRDDLDGEDIDALLPAGVAAGAIKRKTVDGRRLTFVKQVSADGTIDGLVLDEDGAEVPTDDLRLAPPSRISGSLRALLERGSTSVTAPTGSRELEVVVVLAEPSAARQQSTEPAVHGSAKIGERGRSTVAVDGRELDAHTLSANVGTRQRTIDAARGRRVAALQASLRELGEREPALANQPALRRAIERGDERVTLRIPREMIATLLRDSDDLVAGIELPEQRVNLLASAMKDTNVDPWALDFTERRGEGVGVYMSEEGCPNYGLVSDYYRLSGSTDYHAENVAAIIRGVTPEAFLYCRGGYTLPSATDLKGYFGRPRVHIETHSWGLVNDDKEDYQSLDRTFDNHVYETGVAVFVANGNNGWGDGYTGTPASALNVLSVGNYDDSSDTINSGSSYKNSEIGNEKPEFSAPGTNICAGGWCLTGTSMASPHAAGFAADLMGAYPWMKLRPHLVKSELLASADKAIAGGVDKVGAGALNFHRAFYSGTVDWWEGSNHSFASFDAADPLPNNGFIDHEVSLNASTSNVRVALSWLNRGWYTYDHRNDAHSLGMDIDLCVFDPNDALVGCSSSWDNPYEMVSFDPKVTGTYRVRISRYANRDTASKLHMGLSINMD